MNGGKAHAAIQINTVRKKRRNIILTVDKLREINRLCVNCVCIVRCDDCDCDCEWRKKNQTEIPTLRSVCQAFAEPFNTNRMGTMEIEKRFGRLRAAPR